MSDPYSPEQRRRLMEEIKVRSVIRGPESPDKAAWYVEQGVMTAEEAAFWLENRRRTDAYLHRDFDQRLRLLHEANRARPRTKMHIEDIPEVHGLYREGLIAKKQNPRMTWEQVCVHIGVPHGTWKHWRRRLKDKVFIENDPK